MECNIKTCKHHKFVIRKDISISSYFDSSACQEVSVHTCQKVLVVSIHALLTLKLGHYSVQLRLGNPLHSALGATADIACVMIGLLLLLLWSFKISRKSFHVMRVSEHTDVSGRHYLGNLQCCSF